MASSPFNFKIRVPDWIATTFVIVLAVGIAMAFLARQGMLPLWLSRVASTSSSRMPQAASRAAAAMSTSTSTTRPSTSASANTDDTRVHDSSNGAPIPIVQTEAVTADKRASASASGRPRPAGLPADVFPYRRTGLMSETTVPAGLLRDHTTRAGTWGLIHVEEGKLKYRITDPRREPTERIITPDTEPGVVEPTVLHCVEPVGAVKFFVEFHKADAPPSANK